jgi:hypothetical protein
MGDWVAVAGKKGLEIIPPVYICATGLWAILLIFPGTHHMAANNVVDVGATGPARPSIISFADHPKQKNGNLFSG